MLTSPPGFGIEQAVSDIDNRFATITEAATIITPICITESRACGGVRQETADPGPGEDGFDHHRTGDERTDLETYDGQHRNSGVPERMLCDHLPGSETFRAGGAQVVLRENVEHGAPGKTGDARCTGEPQRCNRIRK
jgi:hypothetical protein